MPTPPPNLALASWPVVAKEARRIIKARGIQKQRAAEELDCHKSDLSRWIFTLKNEPVRERAISIIQWCEKHRDSK